jgi:hypothetical protein
MDYIGRKVHVLKIPLLGRKERVRSFRGDGTLSSKNPSALTTVDGVPTAATVMVRWRAPVPGQYGDGALAATTTSSVAGEWSITGLDHRLRYDVSARLAGENDALQSNVQPYFTPRFSTTTIKATAGAALDVPLPIEGGAGTVTAAYVSGTYPTGVTLSAGRLQASAVGSTAGTYTITYDLTDSIDTYTHTLDIVVRVAQLSLPRPAVPEELAIGDTVSVVFAATGGIGPYTYSLDSGTLPTGLSFDASTATLPGTLTAGSGTCTFQIKAVDTNGREAYASFTVSTPTPPHKYWRVYVTAANSYGTMREIEFLEAGVRLSTSGATITASSTYSYSGIAPGYAFDNTFDSNRWTPANSAPPAWIAIEYPSAVDFDAVRITISVASQAPTAFTIQSSDDGTTWTDEWSVAGESGWVDNETRTYPR